MFAFRRLSSSTNAERRKPSAATIPRQHARISGPTAVSVRVVHTTAIVGRQATSVRRHRTVREQQQAVTQKIM